MPQPMDIFELMIDLGYRCLENVASLDKHQKLFTSKFFTLELDMMVGAVMRTIPMIIVLFSLEMTDPPILGFSLFMLFGQAVFIKYETQYIFDGNSDTNKRECCYKIMSFGYDYFQLIYIGAFEGIDDFEKLVSRGEFTFSGFYKAIIVSVTILDSLQIIYLCICKNCRNEPQNYFTPGQAQYFLIFRLIGGIIGIIVVLIFYLYFKNKDEYKDSQLISVFLIIQMCSEFILLIRSIYQNDNYVEKEQLYSIKQMIWFLQNNNKK